MNPKWLLGTSIGLALFSQALPLNVYAQDVKPLYSDLNQASSWAVDSIQLLNELGITQGYENNRYQPRKQITRQEVAVLLARALHLQLPSASGASGPSDIAASSWSYASVQAMMERGWMGDPSEPFRPLEPVTREELVSLFVQATGGHGSGTQPLSDKDANAVDPSNRERVETSVELGLLKGDGATLDLTKPTERQEVAVLLARLIKAYSEPASRESELTILGPDKVRIGAFEYPMSDDLKKLLAPANQELLNGATLKVKLTPDYRVQEIVDLTIPASKHDLTLDGGQLHVTGTLRILGDNLTIKNLAVDGGVVVGSDAASVTSLTFENATLAQVQLNEAVKLTLGGSTKAASVHVPEAAITGTSIVLRDSGTIGDIVLPDKALVPALVQDFSVNRGQVLLVNGKPLEDVPAPSSSSQPTMLYAVTAPVYQAVGATYTLPSQVTVRMSNATTVQKDVVWQAPEGVAIENGQVSLPSPQVYEFTGTVQGLRSAATLQVDVRYPLVLKSDQTVVDAAAGQEATFVFTSEPETLVTTSVEDVGYRLRWFDADNVDKTEQVDVTDAGTLGHDRSGNGWTLYYMENHAVANKETITLKVKFAEAGTYTLNATAIQYLPR